MQTAMKTSFCAQPVANRPRSGRPAPSKLRVHASQQDKAENQQGPQKAAMRAFGALAAAQLALFPFAATADIIPESAKSATARAERNAETSNLPTLGDVGRSLKDRLGGNVTDPKDIGRAIDANTPDAPDLTKNAKDLRQDAQRGLNKLGQKVNQVTPDLSAVDAGSRSQALSNADYLSSKNISQISSLAKQKTEEAGAKAGQVADKGGRAAKGAAGEIGRRAREVTGPVSDALGLPLPNPFGSKSEGAIPRNSNIEELKAGAKKSAGSLAAEVGKKTPDVGKEGEKMMQKAPKNVRGDVSDLSDIFGGKTPDVPSPQEAASKAKGAAADLKGAAKDATSGGFSLPNPLSGLPGTGGADADLGDKSKVENITNQLGKVGDRAPDVGGALNKGVTGSLKDAGEAASNIRLPGSNITVDTGNS